MGMPQKGSRRTTIGNHLYLWRVMRTEGPRSFGRSPGLHFLLVVQKAVEGFEKPGSVALFHLESRKRWCKMLSYSKADTPGTNVSSSDVRELIEFALEIGWDPEKSGPAFTVPANGDFLDMIGGFTLRDAA